MDTPRSRNASSERDLSADAPVVRAIDAALAEAASAGASDIHFEPLADALRVRIRIDGVLRESRRFPLAMSASASSRLKVMARMDIAERRLPQDGRMEVRDLGGAPVEARVSALPTVFGEKIVLRLVRGDAHALGLAELGLDGDQTAHLRRALDANSGMIVVTGPTGSGKTTTLYALLRELNDTGRNIIAVEDPVECRIPGVNQVQVNEDIGLSFPATLRALLRQDPDVIMIGEIRDQVTAEIAVRAALTGHIVLSTLHTTDAAVSVARLVDMGVAPFLVAAALRVVVAQRLARKRCDACKDNPTIETCLHCGGSGLRGRVGIFEVLALNEELRQLIADGASAGSLREMAVAAGMRSLTANARRQVAEGLTTEAEALRAVASIT